MRRYRVVGFCRKDAEPDNQPGSVYLLVTDDTLGKSDDMKFVDADIDEAFEAFQRGWIELGEIPPKRNRTP